MKNVYNWIHEAYKTFQARWCRLTQEQKLDIRLELNYYKICEMRVHPRSLKHNHYYEFMPETFRKMMSRHTARQFQRNVRPSWWLLRMVIN